jgi:hypothetical protein
MWLLVFIHAGGLHGEAKIRSALLVFREPVERLGRSVGECAAETLDRLEGLVRVEHDRRVVLQGLFQRLASQRRLGRQPVAGISGSEVDAYLWVRVCLLRHGMRLLSSGWVRAGVDAEIGCHVRSIDVLQIDVFGETIDRHYAYSR